MGKQKTWSYSKLSSYHNCVYGWYLNYVKHQRGNENVYGVLGGCIHNCLERIFKGEIDIEKAKEEWITEFEMCELLDMRFPTEKSKENYYQSMIHCLDHWEKYPDNYKYLMELHFVFEPIENIQIQGYIDLVQIDEKNKTMRVIDYKTSSKFSKKELEGEKVFQLILYSMYLEEMYPDYTILNACFEMLKYTKNKRGTIVERNTVDDLLDDFDYKRCFVEVEYNDEMKEKLKTFITSTIDEIEKHDPDVEEDWIPEKPNAFYCKNLCGHYNECPYAARK